MYSISVGMGCRDCSREDLLKAFLRDVGHGPLWTDVCMLRRLHARILLEIPCLGKSLVRLGEIPPIRADLPFPVSPPLGHFIQSSLFC
jgi:hypothetical protein